MSTAIIRRELKGKAWAESSDSLPALLKRIYLARGVSSSEQLERQLKSLLPFNTLSNIHKAVSILDTALATQKRITIVGDFDADGATSTAVAVTALRQMGAEHVDYLVPNRFEYGYGLTPEIVEVAIARQQPDLIVTVDNGVSSIAGVKAAKAQGVKVLITDHHLTADELPEADAIVNPNLPGDAFASKNLAGVGVIFYVMLALRSYLREKDWFNKQGIKDPKLGDLLDLVALGTVADVVPLDRNNRILVHQGLMRIRAGKARVGVQALLTVSGRNAQQLVASDLAFALGPRLNAAGRLDDMSIGIVCLLSEDPAQACEVAMQLDQLNRERRSIELEMKQQAVAYLERLQLDTKLPPGVCLYDQNWHQGVIGILAGRVKDKWHRPVIAFANANEDQLKGSARSIKGVHIRDVLDAIAKRHPDLITKFGGHAMAAGLTIDASNFSAFREAFADEVGRHVDEEALYGKVYSDGQLALNQFDMTVAELIRNAGPWGQGFPEPLFDNVFYIVQQRLVGGNHLKLVLGLQDTTHLVDAIAFNVDLDQWPNHRAQSVRVAYKLDVNEYRGRRSLQLMVEHLEVV